jgi:hypothetical protein
MSFVSLTEVAVGIDQWGAKHPAFIVVTFFLMATLSLKQGENFASI